MQVNYYFYYKNKNAKIKSFADNIMCHPTFASNASGTDWNTINDEGTDRTHFLSLIVSNTHPYHAYLTRRIVDKLHKEVTSNKEYTTWEDKKVVLNSETHYEETKEEYLESFELNIEVEDVEIAKTALEIRLDELENSANSYANKGKFKGGYFTTSNKPIGSNNKILLSDFVKSEDSTNNEPRQLSFYPDIEVKKVEPEEVHIEEECISDKLINKHVAILITADMLAPKKVNNPKNPKYLNNYADNMNELFAQAFGAEDSFVAWADAMIDYLYNDLMGSKDMEIAMSKCEDESLIVMEWSDKLIDALSSLANNSYITYYTHALMNYA